MSEKKEIHMSEIEEDYQRAFEMVQTLEEISTTNFSFGFFYPISFVLLNKNLNVFL